MTRHVLELSHQTVDYIRMSLCCDRLNATSDDALDKAEAALAELDRALAATGYWGEVMRPYPELGRRLARRRRLERLLLPLDRFISRRHWLPKAIALSIALYGAAALIYEIAMHA